MRGAIIAGIVALLVSAASATAAFVVTSKNIKNGTIQMVDISANAKRALKGNRGLAGSQGPPGPQGPEGKPVRYTNAYSDHVPVPPGSLRFVNAVCPPNTVVVGGGYATDRVPSAKLIPTNSYPIGMGDGRAAWYVVMQNIGVEEETFWAVAFCVSTS